MMEIIVFLVVALWPVVGLALLHMDGKHQKNSGVLPAATSVGEILARMYLWPIVLRRIRLGRAMNPSPDTHHHDGD